MAEYPIEEKFDIEDITANCYIQDLMKHLSGYKEGFVRIQPSGFVFIKETVQFLDRIRKFEVKDDDIWICTFPKCGTTWTQEMVWCLKNNLDFETSKEIDLDERSIFMDYIAIIDSGSSANFLDTIKQAAELPSPRIIKTHLPFTLLPDQIRTRQKMPKLIHVSRNSRDVCVSHYHHWKILKGFNGSFDLWSKLFLEGYGGYYSPFWEHIASYRFSNYNNIQFLTYEDMKMNLKKNIGSLCNFLGLPDLDEMSLSRLEDHLSFKNFKETPSLNKQKLVKLCDDIGYSNKDEGAVFVRKGIVGDWVNYFSDDMAEKFVEKDKELSQRAASCTK